MNGTKAVYKAIADVSAEIAQAGISKSRKNEQQGYKFRGIDEVYNALAPLLAKHGLVILPRMLSRELTERQAKGGGALFNVVVEAEFDFVCAEDGSTHTVRMFGEAMDSADKATNKAMSAAYKYAAFQTFCIPTEGDNDADSHTPQLEAPAPTERGNSAAGESARSRVAPSGGDNSGHHSAGYATPDDGLLRIARVDRGTTRKAGLTKYTITMSTGEQYSTIKERVGELCQQLMQDGTPVYVGPDDVKTTQWGADLLAIHRGQERTIAGTPVAVDSGEPLDESEIPF